MRLLLSALLGLALVPLAAAQAPCTGGQAGAYACNRVDLQSVMPPSTFGSPGSPAPSSANDIWGWTDPTTQREYALVGLRNGTAFVDVTDPAAPVYLGKLPTATQGSSWRDIKVYDDHAFVVSEASGHGMQVFDLARLRSVGSPPETFTADARYTGAGKAHNIVIDEVSARAYLVGANEGGYSCNGGGLHIVDISAPTAPVFAGCYDQAGYTHDAQCLPYIGGDPDHQGEQVCFAFNTNRVSIINVTDASAPVGIADVFYQDPGYTHQGWLSADRRFVIVNDELDGDPSPTTRTIVLDVADLDNPDFAFFFFGPTTARDHNLYTVGDLVYQSNYSGGLRILDAAGIGAGAMEEIAFFDTYPQDDDYSFNGQWSNYPYFASGNVIASDISGGLFVLTPDPALAVSAGASPAAPPAAGLSLPVPNPTSRTAALTLTVETAQAVTVTVYDVSGRLVATLLDGAVPENVSVPLTMDGSALPSGVYVVRAQGETFDVSRSLTLTR